MTKKSRKSCAVCSVPWFCSSDCLLQFQATQVPRVTSFTISATFENQNSADAALKTLSVDNTVLSADPAIAADGAVELADPASGPLRHDPFYVGLGAREKAAVK